MNGASGLGSGPAGETSFPDVVEMAAKVAGHFPSHPLFPREDGSPETRDIRYVSFLRKRDGDSPKFAPEEFPADEVKSWAQVYGWWGAGAYRAVAKDKNHAFICHYPNGRDWVEFEGESKPFVPVRGPTAGGFAAHPPVAPPPSPVAAAVPVAPATPPASVASGGVDALVTVVADLVREVRAGRAAPPSNENLLVTIMGEQTKLMLGMLSARAEQAPTHAPAPVDSTKVALDLLVGMQNVMKGFQAAVPAAPAPPTLEQQISMFKALRDLSGPSAAPSEFQPLVDLIAPMIAAEATRSSAHREDPRPPPAPRSRLEYVRDVGMVEVVAPERRPPDAPRSSTWDELTAAAQRDPALRERLLHALGPGPSAPPAGVVQAPDVQPGVADPPTASSPAATPITPAAPTEVASVRPPEVGSAHVEPPRVEPPPAEAPRVEPPRAELPRVEPSRAEPPLPASPEAAPATVQRAPSSEPPRPDRAEHQRAQAELVRIKGLGREARVAALKKIPGVGTLAEQVAMALESIPSEAMFTMLPHLEPATLAALASGTHAMPGGNGR
jgi:hypothetical protein